MEFWDKKTETMEAAELGSLQLKRLKHIVEYCYRRVPFYRKGFDEVGLKPGDIRSLEDIEGIPFTTKEDLRRNYPFNMLAVPQREVVRVHASSGTTGRPTVVVYTKRDLESWTDLMARGLYMVGVRREDTVQLIYNYAFFTGGFGFSQGAERIGAATIPAGVGNSKKQVRVMRDFGTTVFSSTPSYALHLAEVLEELDVGKEDLGLRIGVFGAEPWSEGMRRRIEDRLGICAFDNYGLSEVCGPGVCIECGERNGMHIWEDHFLPEIIDPETGEVLGEGEEGELVLSTLTREGMPLLRYRTGDISSFLGGECPCGRIYRRISRIRGRVDDMLIIKGVNVFPSHIEDIVMRFPGIGDSYRVVVERRHEMDSLSVEVEVTEDIFSGSETTLRGFRQELEQELRSGLDVGVRVVFVEPLSLERGMGKAKRVVDLRKR